MTSSGDSATTTSAAVTSAVPAISLATLLALHCWACHARLSGTVSGAVPGSC